MGAADPGEVELISAIQLLTRQLAVANGVPELWTVDDMASWLQLSVSSVKQSVICRPGFPAPLMPTGVDGAARRWLASEVTAWATQNRARLPKGRPER